MSYTLFSSIDPISLSNNLLLKSIEFILVFLIQIPIFFSSIPWILSRKKNRLRDKLKNREIIVE